MLTKLAKRTLRRNESEVHALGCHGVEAARLYIVEAVSAQSISNREAVLGSAYAHRCACDWLAGTVHYVTGHCTVGSGRGDRFTGSPIREAAYAIDGRCISVGVNTWRAGTLIREARRRAAFDANNAVVAFRAGKLNLIKERGQARLPNPETA